MKVRDNGTHTITRAKRWAEMKPENEVQNLRDGDLYVDWFDTEEERNEFYNANL